MLNVVYLRGAKAADAFAIFTQNTNKLDEDGISRGMNKSIEPYIKRSKVERPSQKR